MIFDRTCLRATTWAMPRQPGFVVPGLPHHITQRGVRSLDVFDDDPDRELYVGYSGDMEVNVLVLEGSRDAGYRQDG